jgi:hypothetical protein
LKSEIIIHNKKKWHQNQVSLKEQEIFTYRGGKTSIYHTNNIILRNLVFNPETPSFENSETLMGKYGRR